jgi:hypothetical protein
MYVTIEDVTLVASDCWTLASCLMLRSLAVLFWDNIYGQCSQFIWREETASPLGSPFNFAYLSSELTVRELTYLH